MRWVVGLAMTAVLGLVGAVAMGQRGGAATLPAVGKLPFTISKETTVVMAPLRADGTPDYVAALNERYGKGVTPENNGFVVWLKVVGTDVAIDARVKAEVLKLCGGQETPAGADLWEGYDGYLKRAKGLSGEAGGRAYREFTAAIRSPWKEADHQDVAAYIKAREDSLALVERAATCSRWWLPLVAVDGRLVTGAPVSSLLLMRQAVDTLCARAMLRAGQGDMNGFAADIGAVRRWARHLGGSMTLNERLVGTYIELDVAYAVAGVAARGQLSAAECQVIRRALADEAPMPGVSEVVDVYDRWCALDAAVRISRGHGEALVPALDVAPVDWDVVLRAVNREFDGVVNGMKEPRIADMRKTMDAIDAGGRALHEEWARREAAVRTGSQKNLWQQDAGESRLHYSERIAAGFMDWTSGVEENLAWAEGLQRQGQLMASMADVVLAAAEYKAKTGKWPGVLKDLVPGYLTEVPKDMYSAGGGYDVLYDVSTRGVWVHSVGQAGWAELGVGVK